MRLTEYIVDTLLNIGTDTMFCVPGSHGLKLIDTADSKGLRVILNRHENGAAFAADGYSRMKDGVPGVYFSTVGPGLTNSITGLATGTQDYSRILSLSPLIPKKMWGKGALQETSGISNFIDASKLLEAVTKYHLNVESAEDIEKVPAVFDKLISGMPGSVGLSVCADMWDQEAEFLPKYERGNKNLSYQFDQNKIAGIINGSSEKDALTIIGYGAVISPKSKQYILEFLRKTGFPYITTLKAKGFISEGHPNYAGVGGLYGHSGANELLFRKHKLLISFGVSFSEYFSHSWDERIGRAENFIQVDIDRKKADVNYKANIPVTSDTSFFLRKILPLLQAKNKTKDAPVKALIHGTLPGYNEKTIQPQYFLLSLSKLLPESAAVFCDIGNVLTWAESYLSIRHNQSFFAAPSFASLGYSIPAAIGGKIARPDVPVFAICGDGGFYMTGMEMLTAKQYDTPITVIVFDNKRLDMMHTAQKHLFGERYIASEFKQSLDFKLFAQACGAEYIRADSSTDLGVLSGEALAGKRPLLFHVPIDVNEEPPIKPRIRAALKAMGHKVPISIKDLPSLIRMMKEK